MQPHDMPIGMTAHHLAGEIEESAWGIESKGCEPGGKGRMYLHPAA